MKSLLYPTSQGEWFSMGVSSDQNPYGIQPGLIFSFPCRSKGNGEVEIVKDVQWDPFLKEKIQISEKELLEEKRLIENLL
jgi:malate/lactate dehydrogenase